MPLLLPDSATFPVHPPGDLNNDRIIATNEWRAFDALNELTDHWARPGWQDGARAYYWLLACRDAPALNELARSCQDALSPLGLDPVPLEWLHVTLMRVGSAGSIRPPALRRLASLAAPLLPPAFTVRAIPLAGSRGAVRLSLSSWEPLIRLHAALASASGTFGLPVAKPTAVFRPHLGLAYNNRRREAGPVIEAVASLRSLPHVDLDIGHVQLVELRRTGSAYQWEVVESVPLRFTEFADGGQGT